MTFEVLGVWNRGLPLGQLRAAMSEQDLAAIWTESHAPGAPPIVNFNQRIVLIITIPDDACPPQLVEFAREGEQITPTFQDPTSDCFTPLIPRTFVVAVDRASVQSPFTLRLPANPTYGYNEQQLQVEP